MKKLFLLAVFISLSQLLVAQKRIIFHYRSNINVSGMTSDIKLEQYYLNGRSLELSIPNAELKGDTTYDGIRMNTKVKIVLKENDKRIPFVLKSPDISGLIYAERIWPKGTYLVVDTLNNFNWKISPETKEINGETCTKAETDFRGRKYIAWFKKDNLIKAGPWKFGALPGIIFEVSDTDKIYRYILENIEYVDQFPVELQMPKAYTDDEMISHGTFILKWKANKKDLEKDNDVVNYSLTGSSNIKHTVAPIKELY
jgi:GLPGLI family protein